MNIITKERKKSNAFRLEIRKNKFNKTVKSIKIEDQEGYADYLEYVKSLKNKLIVFADEENPSKGIVINQYYKSRYSTQGRLSAGRRIRQGANYHVEKGVFLTLTYAHDITADQAWALVGDDIKRTMNAIKVKYKRENQIKGKVDLQYFWVIEAQANGYPHVHIFYADIDWLLDKKQIRKIWKRGFVKVKKRQRVNIGKYMAKYLTKQEYKEDQAERINIVMFFVWKYKTRLYGFSQKFKPIRDPMEKRYRLVGFCTFSYAGDPNVPDLQTFLAMCGLTEVEFWWGGGGGLTLKPEGKEQFFMVKRYAEVPF